MNTLYKLLFISLIFFIVNSQTTTDTSAQDAQDERIIQLLQCEQPNLPITSIYGTIQTVLNNLKNKAYKALLPYKTNIVAAGQTVFKLAVLIKEEAKTYANDLNCVNLSYDVQIYDYLQMYGN